LCGKTYVRQKKSGRMTKSFYLELGEISLEHRRSNAFFIVSQSVGAIWSHTEKETLWAKQLQEVEKNWFSVGELVSFSLVFLKGL